jgi:exonuclease III
LVNKLLINGQLRAFNFQIDILALNETHCRAKNGNSNYSSLSDEELEFLIPGYVYRGKSRLHKRKGGIGFFVSKELIDHVTVEEKLSFFEEEICESLFITIRNSGHPQGNRPQRDLTIGTVYLPRGLHENDEHILNRLSIAFNEVNRKNNDLIVTGDFNVNLMKIKTDLKVQEYVETMISSGLKFRISRPSRVSNTSATLIDHIADNLTDQVQISGIITTQLFGASGYSDHLPVFSIIKREITRNKPPKTITRRKINKFTEATFQRRLQEVDFSSAYREDPSECLDNMMEIITKQHDISFPLETVKTNRENYRVQRFMIPSLMKSCNTRDRMKKLLIKNGVKQDSPAFTKYRNYRNTLTMLIKTQKRKFYRDEFERHRTDIRKTMEILNEVTHKMNDKKSVLCHRFLVEGTWIENAQDNASGFNQFFADVGPATNRKVKTSNVTHSQYLQRHCAPNAEEFELTKTTESEIADICKNIKKKTSKDHYGISQKLIIDNINTLAKPIAHLWSRCIETGSFPNGGKIAKVIPVHKGKGLKPHLYTNYRPISLLSIVAKILERIMYNKLQAFLVRYNILFKSQYGFRGGHSTIHAAIDFVGKINEALERGDLCYGVFCDLSKAFDTINHAILLEKLSHYGIRGKALDWFRSYLSDRRQYVGWSGHNSGMLNLSTGVPQGSVLGPLLFLIYINDLPSSSSIIQFVLFADDSNLQISGKDPETLARVLTQELEHVGDWFKANKLLLNVSKTKLIVFRSQKCTKDVDSFPVTMDNEPLTRVNHDTFLGLELDENLRWYEQCQKASLKIGRCLASMRRVKRFVGPRILRTMYNSLILSRLSYGIALWGGTFDKATKRLKMQQKKAVRIITKAKAMEHTEPRQKCQKILKLEDLYKYFIGNLVFDSLKGDAPLLMQSLFKKKSETSTTQTRGETAKGNDIHPIKGKFSAKKRSFSCRGPEIWNELPAEIQNLDKKTMFKASLKKHLISKYEDRIKCSNSHCPDINFCDHVQV